MASFLLISLPCASLRRGAHRLRALRDFTALAVLTLGAGTLVRADTYLVDRVDDESASACSAAAGDCTLRGAMEAANAHNGDDTISFDATVFGSAQTISIGGDLPMVSDNASFVGPGAQLLTVREAGTRRFLDLFSINGGVSASFSGLTISHGNSAIYGIASSNTNISNCVLSQNGAGLSNDGDARVSSSLVSGNFFGVSNSNSATLRLTASTVSDNDDTGLFNDGTSSVVNSTFIRNLNAGLYSFNTLNVTNCTVIGNGSGLINDGGAVVARNSLFVGNDSDNASSGVDAATGNNIVTGTAAQAGLETSDGQNAVVLKNNGGPTPTVALVIAGTAFNTGNTSFALDANGNALGTDQRGAGFARVFGDSVDIGAFELQSNDPPALTGPLKISEFRLSGPGGSNDEYIELANPTSRPVLLSGWNLTVGGTSIPLVGTIPGSGHFLLTNSGGYSLGTGSTAYPSTYPVNSTTPSAYATGDVTYTGDIALNSTLSLSDASGTVVDQVGDLSGAAGLVSNSQYAFVRRQDGATIVDTDTDTNDFNLVSTSSTKGSPTDSGVSTLVAGARLGTPGPQNSASPNQRATLTLVPLNPATNQGIVPDGRYASRGSSLDPFGRLTLRRTITNYGSTTLKQIRFVLVRTTAGSGVSSGSGQASGVADLRAITSVGVSANGSKVVQAIQIEAPTTPTTPSNQLSSSDTGNGGGLNASWNVGTLPAGGLAPGQSMNVEFVFGIVKEGNYNISIVIQTAS